MVVLLRYEAVIDPGELTIDGEDFGGGDARVGWGFGVENPAVGVGDEFVALLESFGRCVLGWKEEEDVVAGDG